MPEYGVEILMQELDPEALEELAKKLGGHSGKDIDPKKFVQDFLESQRKQEDGRKHYEKAVMEFDRRQSSSLGSYNGKKLEISAAFYDSAMEELRTSFTLGEEGGMLAFFKPLEEILHCDEFYGTKWIQRNGYGYSGPMNFWVKEKDSPDADYVAMQHSFGFMIERLSRLDRQRNKDELIVLCHTHHGIAYPSKGDSRPYSLNMIIGFDEVPEELWKLIHERFGHPYRFETATESPEYHGQMPAREWRGYMEAFKRGELQRQVQNPISPEVYGRIVAGARPTIRFFQTDADGNVNRIPLYINGQELP